jgi:hypothetical protein
MAASDDYTGAGNLSGSRLSPPWGWGEGMVAVGCVACIIAALALPWARVNVTWQSIFTGTDVNFGSYTFKLTDNVWLTVVLVSFAAICIAGLFWRRRAAAISIAASLLLLAGSVVYLVGVIQDAFDFLGFYQRLLDLIRSLPMVGPLVESAIRERLSISAFPHAGVFVFMISTLFIIAGGLVMRRRNRAWKLG